MSIPPETCPSCGAAVPRRAKACPGCGADENTGWSEDADLERLGISDPKDFDYDAFVDEEFKGGRRRVPRWVTVVAIVLLAAMAWWAFF